MKKKLLVIEDETSLAKQIKWGLSDTYEVIIANRADSARQLLSSGVFPVVILDLGLPPTPDTPEEGFRILEAIPSLSSGSKVIVVTGNSEQENAMKAVALGAVDFCAKPIEIDLLKVILKRTFGIWELETANRELQDQRMDEQSSLCGMIGVSPSIKELFTLIRKVADTDYPVLIQGESGTGKEMAARAIHSLSRRTQGPLIVINCGAIPENLLESELFGHEKGAFTGAVGRKIGRFEQAEGGTLFLDEIGDMPLLLQVKLLRFLQEHTIERIGGRDTLKVDARIIAATHVDIQKAISENRFREDLFYRLNVIPVKVPPLRDRREDILLMARQFISEESRKLGKGSMALSASAAASLVEHLWPGNIRELQSRIYRAMTTSTEATIRPADLGFTESFPEKETRLLTIKEARDCGEYQAIMKALAASDHNISKAAKLLDVSRPTLHDLLKKHSIDRSSPS